MTYIKTILINALKQQGFVGEVQVTRSKKVGFGDYTSQVLLQNKLHSDGLINELMKHQLIKSVVVVNGHLNIHITEELIHTENQFIKVSSFNRLQMLRDRLYDEGHTLGEIPEYFYPLVKKVNELFLSLEELKASDGLDKDLINLFKKLDLGYIYRTLSSDALGGLFKLFNTCLMVLERANNE